MLTRCLKEYTCKGGILLINALARDLLVDCSTHAYQNARALYTLVTFVLHKPSVDTNPISKGGNSTGLGLRLQATPLRIFTGSSYQRGLLRCNSQPSALCSQHIHQVWRIGTSDRSVGVPVSPPWQEEWLEELRKHSRHPRPPGSTNHESNMTVRHPA